ncbi:MAG: hypothetical protein ACRD2G_05805 [Terriglobia bacterium]
MTEREQQAIDSLAKDEWVIFKGKIRAECEHMASVTPLDLRYTETSQSLIVERFENNAALKVLRLHFDVAVPRIVWQCMNPFEKSGWFTFRIAGTTVLYLANNANTPPAELIRQLTMCLTGQL